MNILPQNSHVLNGPFAAFSVMKKDVCLDETAETAAPRIYGSVQAIEKIEAFIGSETNLGDPRVTGSFANVFDYFDGEVTVVGLADAMTSRTVFTIAKSYWCMLLSLTTGEKDLLRASCRQFIECQVDQSLVFLLHHPNITLEELCRAGRVTVITASDRREADVRIDQAYRMAFYYCDKLEKQPNEKALRLLYNHAQEVITAQKETGLTYVFHNPPPQERSSLSLSASSSASSSDGMALLNNWK